MNTGAIMARQEQFSKAMAVKTAVRTKDTTGRFLWWREQADEAFWYDYYKERISQNHATVRKGSYPLVVQILQKYLPRDGKIIEAGSGTGWIVAALKNLGFDIEGVDYSEELVKQVLEFQPDLPIRLGNVLALDCPDNYYSGYVSLGVIEHRFDGPEPFLKEAYRVVKPNGVLCIAVPYFNFVRNSKSQFGAYSKKTEGLEFYQYGFSEKYYKSLLEDTGFVIDSFVSYGTARCFEEEFPKAHEWLKTIRGGWRLIRYFRYLDSLRFSAHMIMAICRKPA
jgi:SAM-dependent methyltransferase